MFPHRGKHHLNTVDKLAALCQTRHNVIQVDIVTLRGPKVCHLFPKSDENILMLGIYSVACGTR
jgi:hypothetical protein